MILVGYDGSADAKAALESAAALMSGEKTIVLAVWEPFVDLTAISAGISAYGLVLPPESVAEIDASREHHAKALAQQGSDLARRAGLDAEPRVRSDTEGIPQAIIAEAAAVDADAIVVGSRGLSGLRSLLLGGVSDALLHHCDRPMVVVPSAAVAAERRAKSA